MIDINELLGVALKVEGTGYSFYKKLADRTEGERKELFNRLAEQERKHGETFRKILRKFESNEENTRFDDEVAGYLKSLAEVSVFSEKDADNPPENLEDAVRIAINVEKDSIVFYSELIDYVPEKSALERVINEEKTHLRDLLNEFKRDKYITGLSKVSFGFTLKDENSKIVDSELLKGRYSLVLYVKDLDSKNNKKMLCYFDKKTDILKENDIQFFVITKLPPEKISQYRNSEELSLPLYSLRKPDELKHLLIVRSEVIDNMILLFDRWGVKRGYWRSIENEKHVNEIIETAYSVVKSDKLLSRNISLRRARRSFREEKVPRKDIERLVKAAHLAPSCFNKQPWRFVAVDDMETLEKLHKYMPEGNSWMHRAPVLLIIYSRQEDDCDLSDNRSYYLFDTGLAVGMMLTQATKMGLLAHPVAGYKPKKFKKTLDLPDDSVLITVIAIGYQGESSLLDEKSQKGEITGRKRKPVESVFNWHK